MDLTSGADLLRFETASRAFRSPTGGEVLAVEDLSLSQSQGEFLALVGPSGCGKSTLLRLAAGLDLPTSGRVLFRGQPLDGPGRERGVVFQAYNAFPWLTVRENIGFGLRGRDARLEGDKVDRWLALTGLTEFADAYPKTLSGGMRQRLALARTLIVEPRLLLLDEPFGALDEPVRRSMQETLLGFAGEVGCSVLFVTHDIGEAIFLADRVLLMSGRPGRVLDDFRIGEQRPRRPAFYASPAFAELYERILARFPNSLAAT